MITTLPALDIATIKQALAHPRCASGDDEDIVVEADGLLQIVNPMLTRYGREAGATVDSLRTAQLQAATYITLQTARGVTPTQIGLAVGFSVAEQWLASSSALVRVEVDAAWQSLEASAATAPVGSIAPAIVAAMDAIIADPLTVFVAGPITDATTGETDALVTTSASLRGELVQLRVRLYSAPEEADTRVHREFADHETWRDVDEHWIRRSDLAVILHPRAATGLGCVYEIATSSAVPVLVVADNPLTPMMMRKMSPERLLTTHDVVERVVEYIAAHADQMLQRRSMVREAGRTSWRDGRTRLARDIATLSTQSVTHWLPTTITRERLHEVLHDDYAFGSLTDFERLQLRQAFRLPKLAALTKPQKSALAQAAKNNDWSEFEVWNLELAGRELLATSGEWHYAAPHHPNFWEDLHGELGPSST